jgi:alpha-tubulin suppressor-like RCC1 family protein
MGNNKVMCWGYLDWLGQEYPTPELVRDGAGDPLDNVVDVVSGWMHDCALTAAGGVTCWGWPVGDGSDSNFSATPVDVVGLESGVAQISASTTTTCAVTVAGAVKCWGTNQEGEIGAACGFCPAPVDVAGLESGVAEVAVGRGHVCARLVVGTVRCLGANFSGQLGDGTNTPSPAAPVDVVDGQGGILTGVTDLDAGDWHNCAILVDASLRCWGADYLGQVGNGAVGPGQATPVEVLGLGGQVLGVSLSIGNSCALLAAGVVRC